MVNGMSSIFFIENKEYLNELDRVLERMDCILKNQDNKFSILYGNFINYNEMNSRMRSFLKDVITYENKTVYQIL